MIWATAGRRIVVAGVGLTLAALLCLPSLALAADAPEGLDNMVTRIARTEATGPVTWARYVATTADTAADLLGKSRDQLFEDTPDSVYLVVMCGEFSLRDMGDGRGPYLAFLYWRAGDTWNASDFTLLQRPPPLRSAGVPQVIEPFALAHPTLNRAWEYVQAGAFWFLPAILLAVGAGLCAWKRRSAWTYLLASGLAVAVAGWQVFVLLHSLEGRSWDPAFDGTKLAVLAVVVCVDLAAAVFLLRARARPGAGARAGADRPLWRRTDLLLLLMAAALYIASLPWLATTGE